MPKLRTETVEDTSIIRAIISKQNCFKYCRVPLGIY